MTVAHSYEASCDACDARTERYRARLEQRSELLESKREAIEKDEDEIADALALHVDEAELRAQLARLYIARSQRDAEQQERSMNLIDALTADAIGEEAEARMPDHDMSAPESLDQRIKSAVNTALLKAAQRADVITRGKTHWRMHDNVQKAILRGIGQ